MERAALYGTLSALGPFFWWGNVNEEGGLMLRDRD